MHINFTSRFSIVSINKRVTTDIGGHRYYCYFVFNARFYSFYNVIYFSILIDLWNHLGPHCGCYCVVCCIMRGSFFKYFTRPIRSLRFFGFLFSLSRPFYLFVHMISLFLTWGARSAGLVPFVRVNDPRLTDLLVHRNFDFNL